MSDAHATHESITEYDISGLEAILAGTFALMSAYAHCPCSNHQGLMALKIISNLSCLQNQRGLSAELRTVLAKVSESWRQHSLLLSPTSDASEAQARAQLWHAAPSTPQ